MFLKPPTVKSLPPHRTPVLRCSDWWCLSYISLYVVWDQYFCPIHREQFYSLFLLVASGISQDCFYIFLSHLSSKLGKPNSCGFCHWSCVSSSSARCCCCPGLSSCSIYFLDVPCLYIVPKSTGRAMVWWSLTRAGSSTFCHLTLVSGTQMSHFYRQWEWQSDEARVLIKRIIFENWTPTNNLPPSISPEM